MESIKNIILERNSGSLLVKMSLSMLLAVSQPVHAAEGSKPVPPLKSVTTVASTIPVDELELLVEPLTVPELLVEADAWLALLKAQVTEISHAEIEIKRRNRVIAQAEEIKDSVSEAKQALAGVKDTVATAQKGGVPGAAEEADEAVREAQKAVEEVANTVDKAAQETTTRAGAGEGELDAALEHAADAARDARKGADRVANEVQDGVPGIQKGNKAAVAISQTERALDRVDGGVKEAALVAGQDSPTGSAGQPKLEQAEKAAAAVAESKAEEKAEILDVTTALREERTGLIDRLNVILDELNAKLGKTAAVTDNEKVVPYRLYAQSVGGLKVDISDTESAYVTILGWLKSGEGGIRWAKNLGVFLATIFIFWLLGIILSKLVGRALRLSEHTSVLLRNFTVGAVRHIVTATGVIIGLSALEVNVGPLLAVVGAAGFVIAFALQDTLSNFASGLMIMFYKPFDIGDVISVGSLSGTVKSMNLVNTTISTSDNQLMIVPNNSIWGDTITNTTGSEKRRVDLAFGISRQHDANRAEQILTEIVSAHPLVLEEPKPVIELDDLSESSVKFICRPWVKTGDYGQVRWDILRAAKERFDQAGITSERG